MTRSRAKALMRAAEVLQIYADGGGYEDVKARFGQPRNPRTGKKLNAEQLLAWATGMFLSDEAKSVLGARVIAELSEIGFNSAEETKDRIAALKPLGQAAGIFVERVRAEGANGGPIEIVRRIVHASPD